MKLADTPMEENHSLHLKSGELLQDKRMYRRSVGNLIYLRVIRPNIAYGVSLVGQFMHAPRTDHLAVVPGILRYLKGSPGQGILYRSHGPVNAIAFTNDDWVGSLTDRKSTTGHCTMVGGNLVS